MKKLVLGPDLELPAEIAGQTVALVGIRGSGKTNTAGVVAEELLDRHQPIVVLDPTDAWWGLRTGYPVFIFGGPHGDIPLAETDGKVLAEFVVTEQVPLILSLRHLRKNAQRRFVTEFCEELYHLKGKDEYRSPLTVFIDEAPLFIPQRVIGEVARTVGAVEDLISRGRNSGFGVVLISQRPATINKDVLSQADTILSHRLTSPQDRKALGEWIEENATIEEYKSVLSSLATLKTGEAWVWAPSVDVIRRVQIRKRRTFDSSAAPKVGQSVKPPKELTEIDLAKLKGKLAATIEKAKADDPKMLRAKVTQLEQALKMEQGRVPSKVEIVNVPLIKDEDLNRLENAVAAISASAQSLSAAIGHWKQAISVRHVPTRPDVSRPVPTRTHTSPSVRHDYEAQVMTDVSQRILDALAELSVLGVEQPERVQVAFLANYSNLNSKGFVNAIGSLRSAGLIDYPTQGCIVLTAEGKDKANFPSRPRSSEELQQRVLSLLGGVHGRVLEPLLSVYPDPMPRQDLAAKAGYTNLNSKGFVNAIGRLRSLGFIDYPSTGYVVANPVLFIGGH